MATKLRRPSVYYLVPDYDQPSWGIGLLYRHVEMLRNNRVDAHVLHRRSGFSLSWLETDVPIVHLDDPSFQIDDNDVLVVPELLAKEGTKVGGSCRRVVFVQGSFLILQPFEHAISYADLGYERAMVILPHVKEVVERHFGITADVISPFIAQYFFADGDRIGRATRKRQILMFPKEGYREAGFFDYEIARKLLERRCGQDSSWELVEVEKRGHQEVARLMLDAAFMVNVNCLEGFNTTVPEAMAAGCIPVCYEAFGGKDFLVDRHNAFVFQNNAVYPLVALLEDLMIQYETRNGELAAIRENAFESARVFNAQATQTALLEFFRSLGF